MKKANWKDITELIGLIAILGSLIFLGYELRQTKIIAMGESQNSARNATTVRRSLYLENAGIWIKGNSEEALSKAEAYIFEILVLSKTNDAFYDWISNTRLGNQDGADINLSEFCGFLFEHPKARQVWIEHEDYLNKYRNLLHPQGNTQSAYVERIQSNLAKLDQLAAKPK